MKTKEEIVAAKLIRVEEVIRGDSNSPTVSLQKSSKFQVSMPHSY